jgi:Tat protein secretion system quality control protein TatD with DNase activity
MNLIKPVFDTHCHVQDSNSAKQFLKKLKRIDELALMSVDEKSWQDTINLASLYKKKCLLGYYIFFYFFLFVIHNDIVLANRIWNSSLESSRS